LIPHVAMPKLLPEAQFSDHKIETVPAVDHYVGWADACRGVGKATSHFGYSGPLTETVLLGTVAMRVPGETLRWDVTKLQFFENERGNGFVRKAYRKGWEPTWIG